MLLRDILRLLTGVSAALLLASCGGKPRIGGAPGLSVLPSSELPVPQRVDATTTGSPYYVGPMDRITINVFGFEELANRDFQVDASGRISFPLIGVIEVLGKTPGDIEREMVQRLKFAHVRNPDVTVNLKEMVSRTVTVEGEVRKPGIYPVPGRLTLIDAVARAESTTEFSRLNNVVIFRTVSGQRYAALYDLRAIRQGAYSDPEIFAGDRIVVGDDKSRRLFKDVLTAVPALLSPIILLLD